MNTFERALFLVMVFLPIFGVTVALLTSGSWWGFIGLFWCAGCGWFGQKWVVEGLRPWDHEDHIAQGGSE